MRVEIPKGEDLVQKVFAHHNEKEFASIALGVYHFQYLNNPVYQDYCKATGRTPERVLQVDEIPFLPISFFKSHHVETTPWNADLLFKSSGTTGMSTSTHFVKNPLVYEESFLSGFERFYGSPQRYCILGLLPSYLERGNSSLVYMVDSLIKKSGHAQSGFYLTDFERLAAALDELERKKHPSLLIGVTYALLDFAAKYPRRLNYCTVMETGGMKGRRREMTRAELYESLTSGFGLKHIHSEYGMTELLSQAYAIDGIFQAPPWMKVFLRDETDPFLLYRPEKRGYSGAINVIDLANIYSCSFIGTEDAGRFTNGGFEVLGRLDHSDIRGCSLLAL
jgi:hypothetical protein